MKKIAFGQYYPADSVIHRMDARAKIIATILYIVTVFLCKNALCFAALHFRQSCWLRSAAFRSVWFCPR